MPTVFVWLLVMAGATYEAEPVAARRTDAPSLSPADKPRQPATEPPASHSEIQGTLSDADDLLMEGQYDRARELYETLAKRSKDALEAQLGLARCRLRVGEYAEAIESLEALGARRSSGRHTLLATLYRHTGRYHDTIQHARMALEIDADAVAARWLLGQTYELLGRRDKAIETYRWFDRQIVERRELPRDAEWVTYTALGFLRYSVLTRTQVVRRTKHALNEMLQMAYGRIDRLYWPARVAAADLLRQRFNNDKEDGSLSDYQAALQINKHLPEAITGIGEIFLTNWNFEQAETRAKEALSINPRFAPALHLTAKAWWWQRRYRKAVETCDRALETNPNDVVALSIRAAALACQYDDRGVDETIKRVERINPSCALLHRTLGDALQGIRQYEASQRAYLKAIELDPTDANARTELGMMYMQWGREAKARDVLDASWTLDPFNERTAFTLELLEQLEGFARVETPHFIVKYDRIKDPGLGPIVADMVEALYQPVTSDFNTPLKEKTLIELFPTKRAFGVRITGKPWIHTVGAASGRVIALASPRDVAHVPPYDLARVLKHEFTHTVTLAATRNRIPHWFTEGLAVYQEENPLSYDWRQLLAEAARRGRLFTLESIDWGFIRPKRPGDRQMAYAQSEWMCRYIVERFGYDRLNEMLGDFADGWTQERVFEQRLGIKTAAFDDAFRAWAREHLTAWGFDLTPPEEVSALHKQVKEHPKDAALLSRLARAALDEGDHDLALESARRALALDKEQRTALTVLVTVLFGRSQATERESDQRHVDDQALPAIARLLEADPAGWIAPKYGAAIAARRGEFDRAVNLDLRLQRLCPFDPASWRGLAGIHLKRGDDELALPQLSELARLGEPDAEVYAGIAAIRKRRGAGREAQYWYRNALNIDPFDLALRQALGDTSMQVGDSQTALREYLLLTQLDPDNAGFFAKAAFAAQKHGDQARAQALARRAVRLDPGSDAGALLP